jgi:hypothetical protein
LSQRSAPWIAVAALVALVGLSIALATSLPQLTLTEGRPFEERVEAQSAATNAISASPGTLQWLGSILAYGLLAIVVLGSVIGVIVLRRRGSGDGARRPAQRSPWAPVIILLVMVPLIFLARDRIARHLDQTPEEQQLAETPTEEPLAPTLLPVDVAEQGEVTPAAEARATTGILQIAFAILVVGTAAGLIVAALRLRDAPPKGRPKTEMPTLAASVESALASLRSGRNVTGVVAECYREMMRTFAASSGVDPLPLTPREFARALESMGLGGEPLEELTSLFELVRYGQRDDNLLAPRALRCMTLLRDHLLETPTPATS